MRKLSYMIKHFQIDEETRFINFQCRTISMWKALTVLGPVVRRLDNTIHWIAIFENFLKQPVNRSGPD